MSRPTWARTSRTAPRSSDDHVRGAQERDERYDVEWRDVHEAAGATRAQQRVEDVVAEEAAGVARDLRRNVLAFERRDDLVDGQRARERERRACLDLGAGSR